MAYTYGGNATKRQKQLNKAMTGKATDSGERQNRPPQNKNGNATTTSSRKKTMTQNSKKRRKK